MISIVSSLPSSSLSGSEEHYYLFLGQGLRFSKLCILCCISEPQESNHGVTALGGDDRIGEGNDLSQFHEFSIEMLRTLLQVLLQRTCQGIGLEHKLRAYSLQDAGRDTVEANEELGLPVDSREYGIGAQENKRYLETKRTKMGHMYGLKFNGDVVEKTDNAETNES
ncbi:hypothetical protein Bca4012_063162 [Brassica carinata]|uniref:GTP cyclohydrolase II domain-containing protein n=1 Tax=Brassica carinata TaxID=52824 RepID=A0A8X7V917_BRACI|nr:hypothetical protein Bca52824_032902 [Brassica carinata]